MAACLAVFGQVREHEFVGFDDYVYIVQNSNLRDGLSASGLLGAFRPHFSNWIPLTALSYQLDYTLYGLEPAGYHATNLLLHTLSAVLLFLAFARMTGEVWRSGFVAAVFAIHPLHVESVAWVSERKDVLSGLFLMLTLHAYIRYRERPSSRGRYLAAIAFLALGLLAKPMLVTLPFVLLLLDYWPLGRFSEPAGARSEWRRALLEKLPMFALAAVASATASSPARMASRPVPSVPISLRRFVCRWVWFRASTKWTVPVSLAKSRSLEPRGLSHRKRHPGSCHGQTDVFDTRSLTLSESGVCFGQNLDASG